MSPIIKFRHIFSGETHRATFKCIQSSSCPFSLVEQSRWPAVLSYIQKTPSCIDTCIDQRVAFDDEGEALTILEHALGAEERAVIQAIKLGYFVAHHADAKCTNTSIIEFVLQMSSPDYLKWVFENKLIPTNIILHGNLALLDFIQKECGSEVALMIRQILQQQRLQALSVEAVEAAFSQLTFSNRLDSEDDLKTSPPTPLSLFLQSSQAPSSNVTPVITPILGSMTLSK